MNMHRGMKEKLLCVAICSLLFLLGSCPQAVFADVIAVEQEPKSFFGSAPTMTMFWPAKEPKATIVVVLGGGGAIGIKQDSTAVRNQTANMLKILTDDTKSKSMINIVVFDSPYNLQQSGNEYDSIAPRYSSDHLNRIESVVRFYKAKLQTPLWLMGHSNGAVSAAEFINRSEQNRQMLAGAILSGSRNQARISGAISFPFLILHHENDGCPNALPSVAKAHFDVVTSLNKARTAFLVVKGGTAAGSVCTDGNHMYRDAYKEAAGLIEDFVLADR
jgi:hypothetical protein